MTPGEIVRIFNAKPAGKGKWKARCVAHDDRSKDTLRLKEGRSAMLIYCWAGCDVRDVLGAVGLRFRDLFYASRDVSSEALKKHIRQQQIDREYRLEQRMQHLKLWLKSLECKSKPVRTKTRFECDIDRYCRRFS
jgi:hypothetical protein